MRKSMVVVLGMLLLSCLLIGCSQQTTAGEDEKLSIITTIFPEYDWVQQIVGEEKDHVEITMLLDSGVDLHNFQITASDIVKISNCDMFIHVGGESDAWVEKTLAEAANEDMIVINLLEVLGDKAKTEAVIEGMQKDEHEHEHPAENNEYDEHVWLSLKNASLFCRHISEKLGEMDPEHSSIYAENADSYIKQLNDLDAVYQQAVDAAAQKTLLFGDRFPFRYLADDYGLNYYAAFTGCSAETEASFETITFLAGKVDELSLPVILQIETSDGSIPNTIQQNTMAKNQEILTMDSLQSVTSSDVERGVTYLAVMEDNLKVLEEALK